MTNQNKCPDDWPDDLDLVEKRSGITIDGDGNVSIDWHS